MPNNSEYIFRKIFENFGVFEHKDLYDNGGLGESQFYEKIFSESFDKDQRKYYIQAMNNKYYSNPKRFNKQYNKFRTKKVKFNKKSEKNYDQNESFDYNPSRSIEIPLYENSK